MKLRGCKRGQIGLDEVIKWIIYSAILIVAVFAIKNMIGRFGN